MYASDPRFLTVLFISMTAACAREPRPKHQPMVDSGRPPASPDGTIPPAPSDSAAPDSGPDLSIVPEPNPALRVEVTTSDAIACAEPGRRTDLGAFFLSEDVDGLAATPHYEGGLPGATMSAALGDVNGDGHIDVLHGNPNGVVLFYGDGEGRFRPAPEDAWPDGELEDPLVSGVVLVDLDDDGDLDAVVNHRSHLPIRYVNQDDGTFQLQPDLGTAPITTGSVGASVADVTGDGHLELFVGGHQGTNFDPAAPPAAMPAALYDLRDGVLAPSSASLPERASDGYTFVATLLDLNDDGRTDAYLANDHGAIGPPNALLWGSDNDPSQPWVADENAHFLDVPMAGMGIGPGDLNGDGIADLAVSNWSGPKLFLSDATNGWYDAGIASGVIDSPVASVGWGTHMGDYDNDGDLDIYMAYGFLPGSESDARPNEERQPDRLYENDGTGWFNDVADRLGVDDTFVGRTALMVDLNRDGFLDLYLGRQFRPPKVWMARCSDAHWLSIRLQQPPPNSDAIGAKVQVVSASGVQTRWIQAGGLSFGGSPPLLAHFGLGADDTAQRIVVTWPDGEVTESTNIPTRREVRIARLP